MCIFRYIMIVNLVVVKRLDIARIMFFVCLSEKCKCG